MQIVSAPRVLLGDELAADGWVAVEDGRVVDTGTGRPPGTPTVVLPDGVLGPGLVDVQVNGAFGVDLAGADLDGWLHVVRQLPSTGVTAFVPTITTASFDRLESALSVHATARSAIDAEVGARDLGVHVEGPFLSEARRGAHPAEHLCDPTPRRVERLLDAGAGQLAYLTLAPERAGALDAIARLVAAGVPVSLGHTDATPDQVRAAIEAGATLVTHLYNGQPPFHHRAPGIVGVALTDPRLTVGLIADLHHAAPDAVRLAFAAAAGRVALVTDATAAMGMPAGRHELGGEAVEVVPGRPPARADGTLAGSALTLDRAVANVVGCGIPLATALRAATTIPAAALGRSDLGRIAPGAAADLVWLSDELSVRATWVAGVPVHADPAAAGHLGVEVVDRSVGPASSAAGDRSEVTRTDPD